MREIFQKYSREKTYKDLGIDFAYDTELCFSLGKYFHFEYDINYDTGEFSTEGPCDDIRKFIHYLSKEYPMVNYREEIMKKAPKDQLKDMFLDHFNKWDFDHTFTRGVKRAHLQDTLKVSCKFDYNFRNDSILSKIWSVKF